MKIKKSDFHNEERPGSPRQMFHHIDRRVKEKHPALLNLLRRLRSNSGGDEQAAIESTDTETMKVGKNEE